MTTVCAPGDQRGVDELSELKINFHAALKQLGVLAQTNAFTVPSILVFPESESETLADILVSMTVERLTSVFQYLVDEYVYTKELETKFGKLKLEVTKQQRVIRELKRDREHVEAELDGIFRDATSLQMCKHKYNRLSWSASPESDDSSHNSSHALLGHATDTKPSTDEESFSGSQVSLSLAGLTCFSQPTVSPPAKDPVKMVSILPSSGKRGASKRTITSSKKTTMSLPTKSPPRKNPSRNRTGKTGKAQTATITSESQAISDDIHKSSNIHSDTFSGSSASKTLDTDDVEAFTIVKNETADYDEDTDNEIYTDTAAADDSDGGGGGEAMDSVDPVLSEIKEETMDVDDSVTAATQNGGGTRANSAGTDNKKMSSSDHEEPPPDYTCSVCGVVFVNKFTLRRHVLMHSDRLFVCDICGKGYRHEQSLKYHLEQHTEAKKYQCTKCGKAFSTKFWLKRHEMTHDEKQPFICETCGKGCSSATILAGHAIKHAGTEKPYKCNRCNRSYLHLKSFRQHDRYCKPVQSTSDIAFTVQSTSDNFSDQVFICSICQKVFKHARFLKQHEHIHKEPRFICNVCGKAFTWRNSLSYHKKLCVPQ